MNAEIEALLADVRAYGDSTQRWERQLLLGRIEIAAKALIGQERVPDLGPWHANSNGTVISSDSFDHDVQLRVSGDFYSDSDRVAYTTALVNHLNGNQPLTGGLPKEPPASLIHSMCMRYRHDYGLIAPEHQEATRSIMRQLYKEAAGHGFFKWPGDV